MDRRCSVLRLSLLILLQFFFGTKAESGRSVVFVDSPVHRYFRHHLLDAASERKPLSGDEISATVSILLGYAPPSFVSSEASSRLNDVLFPNPFNRPHAVFMLEVGGVEDPILPIDYPISQVDSSYSSSVYGSSKVDILLPVEDDVLITSLDEPFGDCDVACVNKEIEDLAQLLGGSYVGTHELIDGEFVVPLPGNVQIKLHAAKKADREFIVALAGLSRSLRKAVEIHDDFSGTKSSTSPSELILGGFTGFQVLEQEYGPGEIIQQAKELFQKTIGKLFVSLQMSYGGKLAGVILSNKEASLGSLITQRTLSSSASRSLKEVGPNDVSADVLLVRRSLAWITGLILLVSTLLGICFLLYMPLTRDTLLYSNVKLD